MFHGLCQSVCWSQSRAVLKRLNRSRSCLGYRLRWAQATPFFLGGGDITQPTVKYKEYPVCCQCSQPYSAGGNSNAAFHYKYCSCAATCCSCYCCCTCYRDSVCHMTYLCCVTTAEYTTKIASWPESIKHRKKQVTNFVRFFGRLCITWTILPGRHSCR